MKSLPIIILFFLVSCNKKPKIKEDFVDKIIDVAIETKSNKYVEFSELYDNLSEEILEDKNEKLILVEKLKAKDFVVTNYGRGNYPPLSPRIVHVILKKDNCECEVNKIYYQTISDSKYAVAERIKCRNLEN